MSRVDARPREPSLRVVLLLKTCEGGLWAVAQVEELRLRGHSVVAVLPAGTGRLRTALVGRGVAVHDSAFDFGFRRPWRALRGLLRLRRQITELAPDVVHYHLYASALAARLATLGTGVPRVHMVAGPLYLESPLIRAAERLLVRLDTVTVAGSAHTAALYRGLGVPSDRASTVPYGVDVEEFSPPAAATRAAARAHLDVDDGTFLVVMVAYVYAPRRSVHHGRGIKGHDVLLAAWRPFHARRPRSRLLIVGGGFGAAGEAHHRELLARFAVDSDSSVRWVVGAEDVRGFYRAADLSVSPSLSENHGAALEAAAMGVPSVVSDAGALPETVRPTTGWVVRRDDVDALVGALEAAHEEFHAGTLARRGRRARDDIVERFDRRAAAGDVADLIEAAAAGARPTPQRRVARHG